MSGFFDERGYMSRITSYLVPVITVVTLGLAANDAHSGINAPGIVLKAAQAENAGCLSRYTGYADIRNNCSYAVEVEGSLPVLTQAWHNTSISIFSSNSWCQSVTTNGVGNGFDVGAITWTTAGPQTWQTLNLGDRYVWAQLALVYRCILEPGGVIGEFLSN